MAPSKSYTWSKTKGDSGGWRRKEIKEHWQSNRVHRRTWGPIFCDSKQTWKYKTTVKIQVDVMAHVHRFASHLTQYVRKCVYIYKIKTLIKGIGIRWKYTVGPSYRDRFTTDWTEVFAWERDRHATRLYTPLLPQAMTEL